MLRCQSSTGVDAVRQIMRERPTQVLMVSSMTHEGAQITLQAMEAGGAVDYLTKDMRAWMDKSQSLNEDLTGRIIALGKSKHFVKSSLVNRFSATASSKKTTTSSHVFRPREQVTAPVTPRALRPSAKPIQPTRCRIVVIGSSTGGPAALQTILTQLPANFPYPILLVQHMPKYLYFCVC